MKSTLPPLTDVQRASALQKSMVSRRRRASIRDCLRHGTIRLPEVLRLADSDDVVAKMRVTSLIESVPGIGKVRTAQLMERLGIATSRRVRGLGGRQRAALEKEFE